MREDLSAILAEMWKKRLETVTNHVDTVAKIVDVWEQDQRDPVIREAAADAAHKLAGLVGMFGYRLAGEHAHEIERLLRGDGVDLAKLKSHLQQMRRRLEIGEPRS